METLRNRLRSVNSAVTTPNANAVRFDRSYGAKYEPFNFAVKDEAILPGPNGTADRRTILAAQVEAEPTTNRRGEVFEQKKVVCFHADAKGGFAGEYIFLKLRSDSPLQHGQWLDPSTLVVAQMKQGSTVFNGTYLVEEGYDFGQGLVKPTIISEDKVNPLVFGDGTKPAK